MELPPRYAIARAARMPVPFLVRATRTGCALRAFHTVPGATYTATASWSDEYGRQHHGVQAIGY